MQAAFVGGWEILVLMLVLGFYFCVVVVPVIGVVAIVYFLTRRSKTKPQPAPAAPAGSPPTAPVAAGATTPAASATHAAAKAAPAPVTRTEVMPRKCPQCGAALQPDAPEGLCPACLLQRGFATEAGPAASPSQTSFVPPPIAELAPLFPQLEILDCLGRGGMGAVYKARQPRLDRFVALKLLAPEKQNDPQFAERFEREARVLARLSHPNIVSVFDFGEVRGRYYLLMEFVDGLTLRQVMQAGKISPAQALELVPKICEALQYAHGQGIVHRDIKPENILLDKQGRVKIADFGIAKIAGVEATGLSLTGARDVMGTPVYMAPEQVEQPQTVDHRADIYSLGVVFYEMLTGELPLGKFAPPSKKVQVDVRLDEVVLHTLEKEPARRYQQASQVKTAVETIAGSPAPIAPVSGPATGMGLTDGATIITAPAVALMVAGLWKVLSALVGSVFLIPGATGMLGHILGGAFLGGWGLAAIAGMLLFKVVPGGLITFGGYQMLLRRSYAWAIAAGIISIIACSLVSLPIGIWALIVLARDDVKASFGVTEAVPTPGRANHFWRRFVMVLACLILIPATLLIIGLIVLAITIPRHLKAADSLPPLTAQQLQEAGIRQDGGHYQKDFTQSFPFNSDGRLSIDNVDGAIDIRGWSSNWVCVVASIHGKTGRGVNDTKVTINSTPDTATVHTEYPHGSGDFHWSWDWFRDLWGNHSTVDYTIEVPQGVDLAGVTSVNGHIKIDRVTGNITASNVNGDMRINGAMRDLHLSTVNGQIQAAMKALGAGQSVSLNAVNGTLEVDVPANADANFTVSTVSGTISSDFPALEAKKEFPVGNNLNGSLGNGRGSVKIDAVNGEVRLLKAAEPKPAATNNMAKKW